MFDQLPTQFKFESRYEYAPNRIQTQAATPSNQKN